MCAKALLSRKWLDICQPMENSEFRIIFGLYTQLLLSLLKCHSHDH